MADSMEQFGKYRLGERIAVGGMAEIFHAKVVGPGGFEKEQVIKRILPGWSADPEFVRMFINEATLASKLQHANIVQIYDFDQVGGVYYIAMELVEGKDLQRVLQETERQGRPLPPALALYIATEGLKGLHYAHTRKSGARPLLIVHRDISPHNLLIGYGGEVKLTDFGIAKATSELGITRPGVIKGKLAYMAPEQLLHQSVDARTDLYALGIVLWEMLARRSLFQGQTDAETVGAVVRGEVPSLRAIDSSISEPLETAVLRLLKRDPAERFESAADALRALSAPQIAASGAHGDAMALAELMAHLFGEAVAALASRQASGPVGSRPHEAAPPPKTALLAPLQADAQASAAIEPAHSTRATERRWASTAKGRAALVGLLAGIALVVVGATRRPHAPHATKQPVPGATPASSVPVEGGLDTGAAARDGRAANPAGIYKRESPAVPERTGKLTVIVRPWAKIVLDRKTVYESPLREHFVGVGPHTVEIENGELNWREKHTVTVRAGEHTSVEYRWIPPSTSTQGR